VKQKDRLAPVVPTVHTAGYDRLSLRQTRNERRIFVGKTLRIVLYGEPTDLKENVAQSHTFRLVISNGQ
jgi:hypothetical protein